MIIKYDFVFIFLLDREKRPVNSGDEPGLCKNQVLSDPTGIAATIKLTDTCVGNNGGYVPTVGRWGSEWPS